jgi:hypothetical protein
MQIHPFCGSIEDHEEKDTKSIIWAKWVYIMVETGMPLWKRIPKMASLSQNFTFWPPTQWNISPKQLPQGYSIFWKTVRGIFPYPYMGYAQK